MLNVNVRPAFSLFALFLRTQIEAAPHSLTQKMASILTDRVRSILKVTKAVALGYLSRAVNKDMKMTMNHMVAQLSTRSVRPAVVHAIPPQCDPCAHRARAEHLRLAASRRWHALCALRGRARVCSGNEEGRGL